jgi:radical SAM superfamily enzyme YgiQ (UPF0313 family)
LDILLINPDSSKEVYQGLADKYSAIEPPVWSLLLAGALGEYDIGILDPKAEGLDDSQVVVKILNNRPKLIVFVVYGQNPNSGTTNMTGAVRLAKRIKEVEHIPIAFIGSHASALPEEVKSWWFTDYVLPGDGLEGIRKIMWGAPKGIIWGRPAEASSFTKYPWNLIPSLDHYRCHTWHANFDESRRSPFAAIYTSLGCPFRCDFCMINLVNRESPNQKDSSESSEIRYFSADFVLKTLSELALKGVKNVRISDEMFFLNRRHYLPILGGIIDRGLDLNLWAYARVDTVKPEHLSTFKRAGVNWLCLGIEAANQKIRREASKGSFEDVDVREVCKEIREAGINLLANFMMGLPNEKTENLQETVDLALEINAEHTNIYPCMALPGTPLYRQALREGTQLPGEFSGYSFHSEDCLPLPTQFLSSQEVLAFRDQAWEKISLDHRHLELVEQKFGTSNQIKEQARIKLKRSILQNVAR